MAVGVAGANLPALGMQNRLGALFARNRFRPLPGLALGLKMAMGFAAPSASTAQPPPRLTTCWFLPMAHPKSRCLGGDYS
jgi:hypothetical protein